MKDKQPWDAELRAIMSLPPEEGRPQVPSALDSERVVLSMAFSRKVEISVLFATIHPKHFHLRANRIIAEEIVALDRDGMDPDRQLVLQAIRAKGLEKETGGFTYLAELENSEFEATWQNHCIKMVQAYTLRRMFEQFNALAVLAQKSDGADAGRLIERGEKALQGLSDEAKAGTGRLTLPAEEAHAAGLTLREWISPGKPDVPIPFSSMEATIDGFRAEELVIIAGRPGQGKSAMACRMVESWLGMGISVAFFSLEMSKASLLARMASGLSGISGTRIRLGDRARNPLTYSEERHYDETCHIIENWKIWMSDQVRGTVYEIRAMIRPLVQSKSVQAVVVDYLGLMHTPEKMENQHLELNEIARGLKLLSKELHIPVIALHQLNREVAKRGGVPMLSDLRGSGGIEEHADIIMLIHQKPDDQNQDIVDTDFLVAKQRSGATGICPLVFHRKTARFEEKYGA